MSAELVRIRNYKNKQLYTLYYNKSKNEFYVKKSENTNFYIPLRWKHVCIKYTNKKDNESKYKVYRYVHFYNPETKEKIHVTEHECLNNRDKVTEDNLVKEKVKNMTYEEIWNRILEYIANYNTTENLNKETTSNSTNTNTINNNIIVKSNVENVEVPNIELPDPLTLNDKKSDTPPNISESEEALIAVLILLNLLQKTYPILLDNLINQAHLNTHSFVA
jgi:hypothetical protein